MSDPNNFYSAVTGSEIDLRQEMINTLDGAFPEVAKSLTGLLRAMNKDDDGDLIECSCVDKITHEPDKDFLCPISLNERYLWTESYITFYKVPAGENLLLDKRIPPGLSNITQAIFYMRYSVSIEKHDKIIEIELNLDGTKVTPVKRTHIWRIHDLLFFRSDNGRVEFIKAICALEDVKHLNIV